MTAALVGIDIGGTGAKAGVFAVESGERLGSGYVEYAMTSVVPGQAEHDAEIWWQAAVRAIREAIQGIDPSTIAGVGVSCTNGLVAVDAIGRPLRSAIMLWDQRAVPEVEHIGEAIDPADVFEVTGNPVAPGAYSLPTILWLMRQDAETFRTAHKLLVPGGYLVARLTGEFTIDHSRACTTLLFDIRRLAWHQPFIEALDIPGEKLPIPLSSLVQAGSVTAEAGKLTGLRPGTPVVAGCMDTVAASIGCGVVDPGECFVIMGTAARVCTVLGESRFDRRFMNCSHSAADRWLAIGALNGIGSSWRWIRDTFGQPEQAVAMQSGQDPYDLLTAEAGCAPPGSKGLIFLPYISGERTPVWNPKARSVFLGITLAHERRDVLRSVLEGTSFAIRHVVEILETQRGRAIPELRIGGGAARSAVWNQIIADVLGKPVVSMVEAQTEVLGAALLAGVGLGVYSDFGEAIAAHVRPARVYTPNDWAHQAYDELFPIYRDLYDDVEPYFSRLAGIELPSAWIGRGDGHGTGRDSATAGHVRPTGVQPALGEGLGR
jgi:xylulokinase